MLDESLILQMQDWKDQSRFKSNQQLEEASIRLKREFGLTKSKISMSELRKEMLGVSNKVEVHGVV